MSLNNEEKIQLASLLEKVENIEIRGEIWHQLVKKFICVAIEMCILDDRNRVFMLYRKDREFDGYHIPGSVVNDWENVDEARKRLIKDEITDGVGIEISDIKPIGWLESPRDIRPREATRHGFLLLHVARFHGEFSPKEGMNFYELDSLPDNTLGCHKYLLPYFKRYLEDGQYILGK